MVLCVTGLLTSCDPPTPPAVASAPATNSRQVGALDSVLTRRNFYVVFDGSGSMGASECCNPSRKIDVAKSAVIAFAKLLGKDDNIGLYVFDNYNTSERLSLARVSINAAAFEMAVNGIKEGGGTPLYGSVRQAFASLSEQMKRQLGYGEYHIVIVTDGAAGDSEEGVIGQILASPTPIVIHTIGLCIGAGHSLNQPGKMYYTDGRSTETLQKGLSQVLAESEKFK